MKSNAKLHRTGNKIANNPLMKKGGIHDADNQRQRNSRDRKAAKQALKGYSF